MDDETAHDRRPTRHVASDVGFRMVHDLVRIPENNNVRKKRRTKAQFCPSCSPLSIHNGDRYDQYRQKNPEKIESSLTQHVNPTLKMARSLVKNRSDHQQGSPLPTRAVNANRKSQHHRPGTSQNRNNPDNINGRRLLRKHRDIEPCECATLDSTLRDVVNSDDPTEDTDFQLPCDHMASRKICQDSDFYWHSPPGEPHSEPELDSPPQIRHRDYTKPKTRNTGQEANYYENYRALEARVSIETGSSVDKDVREQYERDQQVLKDLYEGVSEFEKRKTAGWEANEAPEEKFPWTRPKQQPEGDDEDDSQYLFESINQFLGKLPAQRKENSRHVVTAASTKAKAYGKTRQEQSRLQDSKLDTRKSYYSLGMDGRAGNGDQQLQAERNSDKNLAGIHLENQNRVEKMAEEQTKEVEYLSETSEEARELVRDDYATNQTHRKREKSGDLCKRYSNTCKPQISGKGGKRTRDLAGDEEAKIHGKLDSEKNEANNRERSNGKRNKEVRTCKDSDEPLRHNHVCTNEPEHKESKRTNTQERSRKKEEITDKMYEEFKNCFGVSMTHKADLELEASKTKTCIDEIIDNSLNREVKRDKGETLRTTAKDLLCESDGLEASPLSQVPTDEMNINIRPDGSSPVLRSDEHIRASRGDCFCKTLAEIVTDCQGPQEYMKKLKNYRLAYLNHMQSDLKKLYSLEKYLASCSLETEPSSAILTPDFSPESKESKNISDKRDKVKGSGMQARL